MLNINKPKGTFKVSEKEEPIAINQARDGTFRAQYKDSNIVALDLDTMKSALAQAAMHTVTSKWVPTILVQRLGNDISLDVKFIGVIAETGRDDKYVISDIISDSEDPSTWKPNVNYQEWKNDGSYALIPFSKDRYESLTQITRVLSSMKGKVIDELFSKDGIGFIDQFMTDIEVIFDVMRA